MSKADPRSIMAVVALTCASLAAGVEGQQRPGEREVPRQVLAPAPPGWTVPRLADGTPDLTGAWETSVTGRGPTLAGAPAPGRGGRGGGRGQAAQPPFAPGGQQYWEPKPINGVLPDPVVEECRPTGIPRLMMAPYPIRIVQSAGAVAVLSEYMMTFRLIYTDGRPHPDDLYTWRWMGHSVGRWDGDTLVVDTAGQTAPSWLDAQGHGHSDALRVIERFRRIGPDALTYEAVIDDPKMFTAPFTIGTKLYQAKKDGELWEYFCEDNKVSHEWKGR